MAAFARLAQLVHRAAGDHFATVLREDLDQVFQVAQLGLTVHQATMLMPKVSLQLRLLVQVVQHHLRHFAALELDDHAHAGLVGLVLDVRDASIFFSLTSSAMRSSRFFLFTW